MTRTVAAILLLATVASARVAFAQGMDIRQASGVPLPATDLPAGTVSVRVVRGSFANNLPGVDVTFDANGKPTRVKTDASGRAQVSGLAPGTRLKASATVDGERLDSQEVTIGQTGIRFVLVAGGGSAGPAAPPATPSAPATAGTVMIGPESRIVTDYSGERLNFYYVLQVVNSAPGPVDIGGPLIFELPREARGAALLDGATKQATVNGTHVTVVGPFAPGATTVSVGFELPFSGDTAHVRQSFPAPTGQLTVFALKSGSLDMQSPQFTSRQSTVEQGQPLVVGFVPALKAGEALAFDVSGLPHHAVWPRNVALGAAATCITLGLWAAFAPRRRRSA
jgi:hypothetical protein